MPCKRKPRLWSSPFFVGFWVKKPIGTLLKGRAQQPTFTPLADPTPGATRGHIFAALSLTPPPSEAQAGVFYTSRDLTAIEWILR